MQRENDGQLRRIMKSPCVFLNMLGQPTKKQKGRFLLSSTTIKHFGALPLPSLTLSSYVRVVSRWHLLDGESYNPNCAVGAERTTKHKKGRQEMDLTSEADSLYNIPIRWRQHKRAGEGRRQGGHGWRRLKESADDWAGRNGRGQKGRKKVKEKENKNK